MTSLTYPFPDLPEQGASIAIRTGINWVRMPLPFALDHVNCWHLVSDDHCCVIDTGLNTSVIKESWNTVFESHKRPDTLLVTHFHPDHSGLAGWFADANCRVITNETEWEVVDRLYNTSDADYQQYYVDWYSEHGIDVEYVEAVRNRGNTYVMGVSKPPVPKQFLKAGDCIELSGRQYAVLTGQGHAPEMIMLYCEEESLLIAADQILPSISPNVSLMPHSKDENPLGSFIRSLKQLKALPADTLVLPSHGLPFFGLHERIDALLSHHEQRLDDIKTALVQERTAASLFELLFKRKLDHQQLSFALGETLAHLRYLEGESVAEQVVLDGIVHFRTS